MLFLINAAILTKYRIIVLKFALLIFGTGEELEFQNLSFINLR